MAFHLALKSVILPQTYLPSLHLEPNKGHVRATIDGDMELIKFFIERGANDPFLVLLRLARRGHTNLDTLLGVEFTI